MVVYGEGLLDSTPAALARAFLSQLNENRPPTLHEERIRCAIAGQLEQVASDENKEWVGDAIYLTDLCAQSIVERILKVPTGAFKRREARAILEKIANISGAQAQIKIPEGFAWYALYPDSYVAAAEQWLRKKSSGRDVAVIGLRSIGTALSAIVAATLRCHGISVRRVTGRPTGDPYRRCLDVPQHILTAAAAIIVDEGPGRSGSSMAAAAEWLSRRGYPDRAITFFPAHSNGPGEESSQEIREWWNRVDVEVGAAKTPPADGGADISHGRSLDHADLLSEETNALAAPLKAPNYLTGERQRVVWKFCGFVMRPGPGSHGLEISSEVSLRRANALAEAGYTPLPVAQRDGWLGVPWIDGVQPGQGPIGAQRFNRICSYIKSASGPALLPETGQAARERMAEIMEENTAELCGSREIDCAKRCAEMLRNSSELECLPSYGDGRLAPHEWIDNDGRLLKLDAGGHDFDHTAVGPQTILWDIAGLIVEWDLSHQNLEDALSACGLKQSLANALNCYVASYAAFHAGAAVLCGGSNKQQATRYYTRYLKTALVASQSFRG